MLPTHRSPTHPGEMLLKEFLEPLGVSQVEALTRWDAQIWLTLQAKWDLWHAIKARGQRPKMRALPKTA